jgi:hypothetical protein
MREKKLFTREKILSAHRGEIRWPCRAIAETLSPSIAGLH